MTPIEQLTQCRFIEPDPAFVLRTRRRLSGGATPVASFAFPTWYRSAPVRFALVTGGLLLVAGSAAFIAPAPALSSSLDPGSIAEELGATVAIQVREISYNTEGTQTVQAAIREIRNAETRHLNPELISDELRAIGGAPEGRTDSIDELLRRIIDE